MDPVSVAAASQSAIARARKIATTSPSNRMANLVATRPVWRRMACGLRSRRTDRRCRAGCDSTRASAPRDGTETTVTGCSSSSPGFVRKILADGLAGIEPQGYHHNCNVGDQDCEDTLEVRDAIMVACRHSAPIERTAAHKEPSP